MAPTADALLMALCAIAVFILALATGWVASRWRIRRWCAREGFELVYFRGARFFEGPGAWFRSENQDAYYIEVLDHQGMTRAGYLVFGSRWFPFGKVSVKWD